MIKGGFNATFLRCIIVPSKSKLWIYEIQSQNYGSIKSNNSLNQELDCPFDAQQKAITCSTIVTVKTVPKFEKDIFSRNRDLRKMLKFSHDDTDKTTRETTTRLLPRRFFFVPEKIRSKHLCRIRNGNIRTLMH